MFAIFAKIIIFEFKNRKNKNDVNQLVSFYT